jgi:hypothetical protein
MTTGSSTAASGNNGDRTLSLSSVTDGTLMVASQFFPFLLFVNDSNIQIF